MKRFSEQHVTILQNGSRAPFLSAAPGAFAPRERHVVRAGHAE
jgi:hypothetical protein